MKDFIKVETPFNVDKLESLLHDHPNQSFVQSIFMMVSGHLMKVNGRKSNKILPVIC
jgi:hypothetical protein